MHEISERRNKNSKTYLQDNGEYKTVINVNNIHYLKNNKYEDIETDFEYEEGFGYKVKKAKHNLRFYADKLRYGFAKNVFIDYTLPDTSNTVEGSKCYFEDAWNSVDLEYLSSLMGVKCNIHLKDNTAQASFDFPVKLHGCTFELTDNFITVSGNNGIVGYLAAPFMTDANGNEGLVTLTYDNDVITYSANTEWLKTAIYPVIIDPTTYQVGASADDGYWYGSTFNNNASQVDIGRRFDTVRNAFARFTSVAVAQGATISAAKITYISIVNLTGSSPVTKIYFNDSDDAVAPTTAALAEGKTLTTANVDWTISDTTSGSSYDSPEIKAVIQEIVNRASWSSGNAMMLLHRDNGSTNGYYRSFRTYNYNPSSAPSLTITYTAGDNETVTPTVGTANAIGLVSSTATSNTRTVTPTIGTATAVGLASTTSVNVLITSTIGTATATGLVSSTANVTTQVVTPTIGTATGKGLVSSTATSNTRTVTPTVGTATGEGLVSSTVNATTQAVTPTVGTATATGLVSSTANATTQTVTPTIGTATAIGLVSSTATSNTRTVTPTVGTATGEGLVSSTVNTTTQAVTPTIGTATAVGIDCDVSTTTTINHAIYEFLAGAKKTAFTAESRPDFVPNSKIKFEVTR